MPGSLRSQGLLVLAAIVVVVAMYLTLNYAMGLTESWAGFMFLVCWAVSHMDLSELAGCAVGAFAGVLVAIRDSDAAARCWDRPR